MPELPDVELYIESLERKLLGRPLRRLRLASPFLLRSVEVPPSELEGRKLAGFRRMGKRIVWGFDDDLYCVLHLMIAGRLRWRDPDAELPKKRGLAAFDFEHGSVLLTEAGTKKRASMYIVRGEEGLEPHDRGGLEVFEASGAEFERRLTRENRTLKRALCDPRLFSGIGNAYSDEILHRARLSPLKLTQALESEEIERLFAATKECLSDWVDRLRREVGDGFPEKVTAFREGMAVHGRYREPCPDCGSPVQRIVYAQNEANYCAGCQTGGKLLADRALSRLLKKDWPKNLSEWEEFRGGGR